MDACTSFHFALHIWYDISSAKFNYLHYVWSKMYIALSRLANRTIRMKIIPHFKSYITGYLKLKCITINNKMFMDPSTSVVIVFPSNIRRSAYSSRGGAKLSRISEVNKYQFHLTTNIHVQGPVPLNRNTCTLVLLSSPFFAFTQLFIVILISSMSLFHAVISPDK